MSYRELDTYYKKYSRNLFGTFHALLHWFFLKNSATFKWINSKIEPSVFVRYYLILNRKVFFGFFLVAILTLKTWIFIVEWNSELSVWIDILLFFERKKKHLIISLTFQAWKKENPMITEFQFLSGTRWRLIVGFDLEDFNLYYLFMLLISIIMLFLFPPAH